MKVSMAAETINVVRISFRPDEAKDMADALERCASMCCSTGGCWSCAPVKALIAALKELSGA
jgi:hypothetical protein